MRICNDSCFLVVLLRAAQLEMLHRIAISDQPAGLMNTSSPSLFTTQTF